MIGEDNKGKLVEYFSEHPVDVVYVFGSLVEGRATHLSDVDVGVLFEEGLDKKKRFELRMLFSAELAGIFGVERVDVVDLVEASLSMRYSVIQPRSVVYCQKRDKQVEFEYQTLKYYFDYQPYMEKIANIGLQRIAEKGFVV